MLSCRGLDAVPHVVRRGKDHLRPAGDHLVDDRLDRRFRAIGRVHLVQDDHRLGGQAQLLDNVQPCLVVRLRPPLVVLRTNEDHSELEVIRRFGAVVTARGNDQRHRCKQREALQPSTLSPHAVSLRW